MASAATSALAARMAASSRPATASLTARGRQLPHLRVSAGAFRRVGAPVKRGTLLVSRVQVPDAATEDPKWLLRTMQTLDMAINDIQDYAEWLSENDEEERHAQTVEVMNWLVERKGVLVQGCKANKSKKDCDTLEIFGRLVEDLESSSSVPDLVHILSCQCHAEKGTKTPLEDRSLLFGSFESQLDDTSSEKLMTLFHKMDANGDGKLSMVEFQNAMDQLGEHLDERSVGVVAEAFDIHGTLDPEQFIAIVQAEEVQAHTPDSDRLRFFGRTMEDLDVNTPDWNT